MKRTLEIIKTVYGQENEGTRKPKGLVDDVLRKNRSVIIEQGGLEKFTNDPRLKKALITLTVMVALIPVYLVPIYYYNKFYSLYDSVLAAESVVDTVLEKRFNLTVNLSRIVVDYAQHEQSIFNSVIGSRSKMMGPDLQNKLEQIKKSVGDGPKGMKEDLFARLFALAEQYPDLKLSQNYQKFSDALVECEKEIATSRQGYVEKVDLYSVALETFPGNFFNWFFRFSKKPMFKTTNEARSFTPIGH